METMAGRYAVGFGKYSLQCIAYCILISVVCASVHLKANQEQVTGMESQSALLPAVYNVTGSPPSFLVLTWTSSNSTVIVNTVRFTAGRVAIKENKEFVPLHYKERVHIYPANGSLLLRNITQEDAGVYTLTVKDSSTGMEQTAAVKLTILPNEGLVEFFPDSYRDNVSTVTNLSACNHTLSQGNPVVLAIVLRTSSLGISALILTSICLIAKAMSYREADLF
ncbi:hypothetical protein MATL_G00226560 [Megalops atlanticus]|uniref:Ig-like domain-containing protein n=1 Tax=Megalops atlanticus TaxID=7932 RepID=A0A9D3PJ66_MEGAT|nr:hypothetical protein MATL_G00226560 [Megalops atlanticus]